MGRGAAAGDGAQPDGAGEDDNIEGKAAPKTPVGVLVLEDGAEDASLEMNKLLRHPRYFDTDFEDTALRCFRCGGFGHMSKDCKNEVRQKPCILCAQFGHQRNECPQALCFKCKRAGHMSRDCPYGSAPMPAGPCLRCGIKSCKCSGLSDYERANGGCTMKYRGSDLALVRCYVCGAHGHLTCKQTPKRTPDLSCYNCGQAGHAGANCREELPPQLRGEQAELSRQRAALAAQQYQQRGHDDRGYGSNRGGGYGHGGYDRGGGYGYRDSGGYGPGGGYGRQVQYDYSGGYGRLQQQGGGGGGWGGRQVTYDQHDDRGGGRNKRSFDGRHGYNYDDVEDQRQGKHKRFY